MCVPAKSVKSVQLRDSGLGFRVQGSGFRV